MPVKACQRSGGPDSTSLARPALQDVDTGPPAFARGRPSPGMTWRSKRSDPGDSVPADPYDIIELVVAFHHLLAPGGDYGEDGVRDPGALNDFERGGGHVRVPRGSEECQRRFCCLPTPVRDPRPSSARRGVAALKRRTEAVMPTIDARYMPMSAYPAVREWHDIPVVAGINRGLLDGFCGDHIERTMRRRGRVPGSGVGAVGK